MGAIFSRLLISILLASCLFVAPGPICASPSSLDEIPEHLPFTLNHLSRYNVAYPRNTWGQLPVTLLNMDQDPELEIIRSKPSYILCEDYTSESYATHWQLNFPAEFHSPNETRAGFGVSNALDLGTGKTMIVATGNTADAMNTRFWVIDAEAGEIISEFDMAGGPDTNQDGRWDGTYQVLGELDVPSESGSRKALIVLCNTGFDLEKRGTYAVDPWTGEILWSFRPGSLLNGHQCRVVDLDGDGNKEVLLASRSPHNLHGRKVNGFSDDRPYLFALGSDGSLLWSRELNAEPCATYLQCGDLDGDGDLEIVTTIQYIYQKNGAVSVWNIQGELLADLSLDYHLLNCFLMPAGQDNHLNIYTGNRYSNILRIEFENDQLTIRQEAKNKQGINILGVMDLPGRPGEKGLITQARDGQGRILDQEFNIVASFQDGRKKFTRFAITGDRDNTSSFIMMGSKLGSITLKPNPLAMKGPIARILKNPRLLVLVGLGLGLVLAWFFRHIGSNKAELSHASELLETNNPIQLQERRLHLLEDLEISNHGAMAPLRSLRRLLWMLDAIQTGVGLNANLVARMKEIWLDCHEDALPRLSNILERAGMAQVSDSVVSESLESIAHINSALVDLNHENFTPESVNQHLANLHKEEKITEALLQSLRRQVGEYFHTSLDEVLEKVLRANQQTFEEFSIQIEKGMVAAAGAGGANPELPPEPMKCRMDADELCFIMDNLVGNACRAMASSPLRKLRITWQPANGMVKVEVSDTGIGIATEDHQRVLESGYSSRPGGGLGLPKSLRILRKYDGHLSIKRSKPGQGTTFTLVVPRA